MECLTLEGFFCTRCQIDLGEVGLLDVAKWLSVIVSLRLEGKGVFSVRAFPKRTSERWRAMPTVRKRGEF